MNGLKRFAVVSSLALVAVIPVAASAHRPRIVETAETVKVAEPEISQAFYGELSGTPARFSFETAEPIGFYAGVLAPDLPGADKDYSISVMLDGRPWKLVTWVESDWQPFHEEFAGDDYFKGPEVKAEGPAGRYEIAVFSPDNVGKYVFVVGEKESFPLSGMFETLATLAGLKTGYFGKPWISTFTNRIGFYLALSVAALAAVIAASSVIAVRLLRKRRKSTAATKPQKSGTMGDSEVDRLP